MNILVIDTGSSSMRGVLFSETMQPLHTEQVEYYMREEPDGTCEMDPQVFSRALSAVCTSAARYARENGQSVDAISLTSQRSSVLALDAGGTPLGSILMWHDRRSAADCAQLTKQCGERFRAICGQALTPVLSAPKMALLRRLDPEQFSRAHRLAGIHDYLTACLTGEAVTDWTLASRTGLFDLRSRSWSDELLAVFGIPREKLCRLVPPGSVVGTVTAAFGKETGLPSKIPVVSAGGDQQCSVLGQGILRPGQIGVTVGTGAYACLLCEEPSRARSVNCSAAAVPGGYLAEAGAPAAGVVYRWFRNTFFPESGNSYDEVNRAAAKASGADVILLPCFSGLLRPMPEPEARGCFWNLSPDTTRGQMARAVLEGIAAETCDCVELLRDSAQGACGKVRLTGGLARLPLFAQLCADMLGCEIGVPAACETTAAGAWISAAAALGLFASQKEAAERLTGCGETCYRPDPENGKRCARLRAAQRLLEQSIPSGQLAALLRGEQP